MRVKIRAEGGSLLGFGHWSRCLFLISCTGNTVSKTLYTFNSKEFEQFFPSSEVEVVSVEREVDFMDQISPGDIVVVDGYDFDSAYLKLLKKRKALVVYIDDLILSGLNADVIINHCPGITPADYVNPAPSASFFLGGSYSLVPADFRSQEQTSSRITTLLIAMGGADPFDFTSKILRDNKSWIDKFDEVEVIVGGSHSSFKALNDIATLKHNLKLHRGIPKTEVVHLMQKAGVAILSASTMALEYAHVGGLLGILETADNQKNLYKGLIQSGGAMRAEDLIRFSDDLSKLHAKTYEAQRTLFDGLSAERFGKLFRELKLQGKLRLRKAEIMDLDITFKWATDSSIRMFSFSQHEISWKEHEDWFAKKATQHDMLYLIAEIGNLPVGSIRFDIHKRAAAVSYLVDKSWHGQGLGRVLLSEGIMELQRANLQFNSIIGYVMKSNIASIKIFERMGFLQQSENSEYPNSVKFYKNVK